MKQSHFELDGWARFISHVIVHVNHLFLLLSGGPWRWKWRWIWRWKWRWTWRRGKERRWIWRCRWRWMLGRGRRGKDKEVEMAVEVEVVEEGGQKRQHEGRQLESK